MRSYPFIFILIILIGCSKTEKSQEESPSVRTDAYEEEKTLTPSLSMVWESDTMLTTVESVLFDEENKRIFASCIDGSPSGKDGKGFISILDERGKLVNHHWVSGLNAPKGMAILGDYLYVTDIDRLVEIELHSGQIANYYPVEGADFLNDVTSDRMVIYFSDLANGNIHIFSDGEISTPLTDRENINGLAVNQQGDLYGLDADGLQAFDTDGNVRTVSSEMTNGDGLVVIDDETFISSRWDGEIFLIHQGSSYLLLDTRAQNSNTADIGYIPEDRIILVPTFHKNKVVAYRLSY
jgi:hypothetical protein